MKRLDVSNGKDSQQLQQQQQPQHLQTTQIVQQTTSPYTSQEYFTNPVLPTLPSLQVTSADVQIQADISADLPFKDPLKEYQEGYLDGLRYHFQSQLLLQSSQISKFYD